METSCWKGLAQTKVLEKEILLYREIVKISTNESSLPNEHGFKFVRLNPLAFGPEVCGYTFNTKVLLYNMVGHKGETSDRRHNAQVEQHHQP